MMGLQLQVVWDQTAPILSQNTQWVASSFEGMLLRYIFLTDAVEWSL